MYYAFVLDVEKLDASDVKSALNGVYDMSKIKSVTVINYTSPKVVILKIESELTEGEKQAIKETISSL